MLALILAATAVAPVDPVDARFRREFHAAPRAVRMFLVRRANCNHWAGEAGYDADRERQIEDAARHLRCNRIEADERHFEKIRGIRWLLAISRDWDMLP